MRWPRAPLSGRAWLRLILLAFLLKPAVPAARGEDASSVRAPECIRRPAPLVIGHRGSSRQAPENTLPAFRLALADRADLVELDYHHSADGVPVVLHDGTLDRTTDATNRWGTREIRVQSRTTGELATLDTGSWWSPVFRETRVPTLVAAVEAILAGGTPLIERKGGDAATLVRLLDARGWTDHVVVQSFDWAFVREARRLSPSLVLGALGPPSSREGRKLTDDEKRLSAAFVEEVVSLGAQLLVWNRQVDASSIALAHQRGLRVWVYTINDPAEAAALAALGVDGIITDDPAAIRARLHPQPDEVSRPPVQRGLPQPLPDRPGNIFLEGDAPAVRIPDPLPGGVIRWRLLDEQHRELRAGPGPPAGTSITNLAVGSLGPGWYRVEFDTATATNVAWTPLAILRRLKAPVPGDSPVCVDSAASWFAPDNPDQQRRLANLAALAGVNWVRDRLRWRDLQPAPGPLVTRVTTYDTAATIQHEAGLKVLQVFHDTPPWARESPDAGGRFAPDLRHVHALGHALAARFRGRVDAWEPWNEANVATFGAHTVDEMCSWQKAAWLGFKAGDPSVTVGWNVTTAVPTPAHTAGLLANETWPYFDTYNIHTYDWSHAYAGLWRPAREAVAGRPLWITEADRGTPHLKQAPWFDQDPRLEQLKAAWIAQSYASSLFAGARRHFHFILGHYHEPNGVQFGLLRLDLTPRPAYVALATVGRCLAGARVLGRWRPGHDVTVVAFRAFPDGAERDVLVAWAEKEVDWDGRGVTHSGWAPPVALDVLEVTDHLGRPLEATLPATLGPAPVFVFLPPGQAATLPLEPPPPLATPLPGEASPVVLQLALPRANAVRVDDLPWSEGYARTLKPGTPLQLPLFAYNFGSGPATVSLTADPVPEGWQLDLSPGLEVAPGARVQFAGVLRVEPTSPVRDAWVTVRANVGALGRPVLAFRVVVKD